MMFGCNLVVTNNNVVDECPICLEICSIVVKQPSCCHKFCIPCFRQLWNIENSVFAGDNPNQKCPMCRHLHEPKWKTIHMYTNTDNTMSDEGDFDIHTNED